MERVKERMEKTKAFLNNLCLNKFPEAKLGILDGPITVDEITKILKGLPERKSPGPDGLTTIYYKKF